MRIAVRVCGLTLWLAALCDTSGAWASSAQVAEQDLKAAYIFNFVQFIEWPPGTRQPGGEFTLCVAPFSPLKRSLTALDGKRTAGGRTVRLKLSDTDHLQECRGLVVDAVDAPKVGQALRALPDGHGVLTIADGTPAPDGAVIVLAQQGGVVVFTVDQDAAARAGLTVSSRLLRLSRDAPR